MTTSLQTAVNTGCMLNAEFTQVTHPSPACAADQQQEVKIVWPKIVPLEGGAH